MVGPMNAGVTDIAQARTRRADPLLSLKREPLTVICQAANIRADGEVHRQIGFSDALTLHELQKVLHICFGLPDEKSPWHFYEHTDGRGSRLDPERQASEFLWREGDQIDFVWGLWDFELVVAEIYPRDNGTPSALCVGGSGNLFEPFELTSVNRELTGEKITDEVLAQIKPQIRALIERTKLYDFVPLLQAMDLNRGNDLPPATTEALASLPCEVTNEGKDAFWSMALALSCMGGDELTDSVVETTMDALGWVNDDGNTLKGAEIRALCDASLNQLSQIGAYGQDAAAPVYRLDIYRALLRG
ncbi:hypothetical protein GWO52_02750 [Corynebacterium macginleyi]|uniref:hypothetical protein n=1 Tax=Corynebacterium macginleyi TaxID=38290 RepID=UPI001909C51A|nr:hypothetical protein [Corynebacterium macginleyi]MBK4137409.1 hypothetical protein [Corynebacterium macginleyi]